MTEAFSFELQSSWEEKSGEKVRNFELYHFMSRNSIVFAVIAPGFSGVIRV